MRWETSSGSGGSGGSLPLDDAPAQAPRSRMPIPGLRFQAVPYTPTTSCRWSAAERPNLRTSSSCAASTTSSSTSSGGGSNDEGMERSNGSGQAASDTNPDQHKRATGPLNSAHSIGRLENQSGPSTASAFKKQCSGIQFRLSRSVVRPPHRDQIAHPRSARQWSELQSGARGPRIGVRRTPRPD